MSADVEAPARVRRRFQVTVDADLLVESRVGDVTLDRLERLLELHRAGARIARTALRARFGLNWATDTWSIDGLHWSDDEVTRAAIADLVGLVDRWRRAAGRVVSA